MISHKFLAGGAAACSLALAPVAFAAGAASVTVTPKRVKEGTKVEMLVRGMKPNERVRAHELIVATGQKRTLYPRAGAGGSLLVRVRAQEKGRHVWRFTGRQSRRRVKASYVVR